MNNLKKLRTATHLTQQQIANFLHIAPSQYLLWEHNVTLPKLGYLLRLCEILKCNPVDFFISSTDINYSNQTHFIPLFHQESEEFIKLIPVKKAFAAEQCIFAVMLCHNIPPRLCVGDWVILQKSYTLDDEELGAFLAQDGTLSFKKGKEALSFSYMVGKLHAFYAPI